MQTHITPSEEKVMLLFWKGYSRKEIARRLHRAESTIQTHEHNIHVKLGIKNRADMFRYMMQVMYHVNTKPIKQRMRALLAIALVLCIEFGGFAVIRTKAKAMARTAKPAKARRMDNYDEDKTYLYLTA